MSTEETETQMPPTPGLLRSFQRRIALLEGELKVTREALRQADAELMKREAAAVGADVEAAADELLERLGRVESGLANHKQSIEALNASIGPHPFAGDSVSSRLRHLELSQKTDRDAVTEVALLGPKFANLESRLQELTDLYRDLAVRLLPDTR